MTWYNMLFWLCLGYSVFQLMAGTPIQSFIRLIQDDYLGMWYFRLFDSIMVGTWSAAAIFVAYHVTCL
jgi:hypothetical protein